MNIVGQLFSIARASVLTLVTMVCLAPPQSAWGQDGDYDNPSKAFSWYSKGRGCIHFKLLMFQSSPVRALTPVTIGLRDANGNSTDILWASNVITSVADNGMVVNMKSLRPDDSHLFLTNDVTYDKLFVTGSTWSSRLKWEQSKSKLYAEFDWYYPVSMAGKKYTVYCNGTMLTNGNGTSNKSLSKDVGTLQFDAINFQVYDAIPGTDSGEEGLLKVPFSCDRPINWIEASYTDENGVRKETGRTTYDGDCYSGFFNLPATEEHNDLTVTADITSASWNDALGGDPSSLTGTITDNSQKQVAVLHNPRFLRAQMQSGFKSVYDMGAVELKWQVNDPKYPDLLDGDQFVVQRSLTGKTEDFKEIGGVMVSSSDTTYVFKDSTLISSLTPELIDKNLGIPLVRYRVFRASSQQLWGMEHNPAVAYAQPTIKTLTLQQPAEIKYEGHESPKAVWSNEAEHKVKVSWDYYGQGGSQCFVWDSRAQIMLRIYMYNKSGVLYDSISVALTDDDIIARSKEITLDRSCTRYRMRTILDDENSPIGKGTGDIFVVINNDDDFHAFADRVNKGETGLNAILMSDIYMGNKMIGNDEGCAYNGNFNGNGHTMKFEYRYKDGSGVYHAPWICAPFRYATDGAVICNVKTTGTIMSHNKFAAGVVGRAINGGVVHIENCSSSMLLYSVISNGDRSFGGIIALREADNDPAHSSVLISNTLFNGAWNSSQFPNSFGGFMGWSRGSAFTMISNSHYAPQYNEIARWSSALEGSCTFVRTDRVLSTFIQDCSYTETFGAAQGKESASSPQNWCWGSDGQPMIDPLPASSKGKGLKYADVKIPQHEFYYENLGRVDKKSIRTTTLQSSVLLEWDTENEVPVDYYEVWRCDTLDNKFNCLVSQLVTMQYEDTTTSPTHGYKYFVRGITNCEGEHYDDTDTIPGYCTNTGMVEGYVRFPDGTGIPNRRVNITSSDGSVTTYATTDESGYFKKDCLPYFNSGGEVVYTLAPQINGFTDVESISFGSKPGENHVKDIGFIVNQRVKFSGYVLYNGTSIPVQGVSFLVDGYEVHNAAGRVTSNHQGEFSFHMLKEAHTIQAVKDGHVFYQNGYYHENNDTTRTKYDFNIDKAGIYFYDDTRVKLVGRIAGGHVQGDMPLDNSLSRNNLGEDLQMVLTLEGDNASRLVWDIQDRNLKERDEVFKHQAHDNKHSYQTQVHTTINRMVVHPDEHTGEYVVWLPPVKWKIQQITAKGYPTLFQDGKTGDVIDLSDSLTLHTDHFEGSWTNANKDVVSSVDVTYHAQYNRIYRTPVKIDYRQQGYAKFDYLGELNYQAKNLQGDAVKVPLAYAVKKADWPAGNKDSLETRYTFGYPVFDVDRKYPIRISATEKYYYNNKLTTDTVDVIHVAGGIVTIHNGMISATHSEDVELDSNGEAIYTLEAQHVPYLLTGKDALHTVTFTLEMDSTYYEATPLRAYTFDRYQIPGAQDVMSINKPQLIDILRDPPGSGSSATLSRGSTLKYSYTVNWSVKGGVKLNLTWGAEQSLYTGIIVAMASEAGVIQGADSGNTISLGLIVSAEGEKGWSYTVNTGADISTGDGDMQVGADADVYIGTVTNLTMKPALAIRAIPESMWHTLQGELRSGRLIEIASGRDDRDSIFHLVRDEVFSIGPQIQSTFVHSQQYITHQIIPGLLNQCYKLMFTGTEAEAKTKANAEGKPVYLSLRNKDDEYFGCRNATNKDGSGDYIYNSTADRNSSASSYLIVLPDDYIDQGEDEVRDCFTTILEWIGMVYQNEKEKLSATDLVKNIDIDGGTGGMSYEEEFEAEYTVKEQVQLPGMSSDNLALVGTAAEVLADVLKSSKGGTKITPNQEQPSDDNPNPKFTFQTNWGFMKTYFQMEPVAEYNSALPSQRETSVSRKESFDIKLDLRSHLDFDVYRVKTATDGIKAGKDDKVDVFTNASFNFWADETRDYIDKDVTTTLRLKKEDLSLPHSFVYRTRGGATCRPHEAERKTLYYRKGTLLDERTKKLENPRISIDKQSISGVPYGEPARFKLYITNESEQPENTYVYYDLYQEETSNPNGAKMLIDGLPVTGQPRNIELQPGQVTEKELEVYAGEAFDYEDLTIGIISEEDIYCYDDVSFSVHFLPTAGKVEIASPGDKWIMNTDAPYDSIRGWHMPVVISGFDKNQRGFDHIEFQYKESARGDDYWTNLCGYYADSTAYAAASGTKAMIPPNGNIITDFYGEGVVMQKAYDLRAVLFCRNGNGFLTNSSEVISGVKDTRRPVLLGAPEPRDGILGSGSNIVFSFSEDIEDNYLQKTANFQVTGETNETAVQEAPSLRFDGNGYAQSEAQRNFADKSVTIEVMVMPDDTGSPMPIFSHGLDGKTLELWLTADRRLRAVVDSIVLESDKAIPATGFQRVALVLDNTTKRLSLFSDGLDATLDSVSYSGYGPIIFGSTNEIDVSKRTYYKGRMLQGRIWNRALDINLLNAYGDQLLTGYEMGLTDYYPMNEGRGEYASDGALGAHLKLNGVAWALPEGMSLHLDWNEQRQIKGMQLKDKFFRRSAEQDYTLMFWFKTDTSGRGALLSNGAGRANDLNATDKFFIGFEGKTLKYRTNGHEYPLGDTFSDNAWHHYAMTVNRAYQIANIYVDNALKASFATDSLGGMQGNNFYIGNMVWQEQGAQDYVLHQQNALTGYIDGIALFEQALPLTLINRYSNKSLGGAEKGLITYLDFDAPKRQKNGDILLEPFALNQKTIYDDNGNVTDRHDSVFVSPVSEVIDHIDRNTGAPIQAYEQLRNLNFNYVGRDNQLFVNIDEQDMRINKRTIYVTISDIPDMNGNLMASPATMAVFVDRNPLRWSAKSIKVANVQYGYAESFDVKVVNTSGAKHSYTIDNMPKWLTVDVPSDIIDPLEEQLLTFTVSKDANVGSYDDIIYLTDENGLSEPLALTVEVEGQEPNWSVDNEMQQFSMNIVARVQIKDDIVTDERDIVGVFDATGRCMGSGQVNYDAVRAESLVYLTVYDSTAIERPLGFKLWHYKTGKLMVLTPSEDVFFKPNSIVGDTKNPIVLKADKKYVQTMELYWGWNWVSLNVYSNDYRNMKKMLQWYPWQEGDMLTDETNNLSLYYKNGQWISNKGVKLDDIMCSAANSYRIKVNNYISVELTGNSLVQPGDRTITVKNGWNSIGYTPMVNLPVTTALADYLDEAEDGDIIKSRTEFAMFTVGANGTREWKGNLQYMKPGEGYMLYRKKPTETKFIYPYFEPSSTFFEGSSTAKPKTNKSNAYANTMSLTAVTEGVELLPEDKLIAYSGNELRGESGLSSSPVFYMSINGDDDSPLSFAIERDGEIIATTTGQLSYHINAISGTPNEPTKISFKEIDDNSTSVADGQWYTLQGIRLNGKPTQRGIYIYNGHKQIVR